jgi:hypothetical protein
LVVKEDGVNLDVRATMVREYADDETFDSKYKLDGTEAKNEVMKSERTTVGHISDDKSVIDLSSVTAVSFGPPGMKFNSHENWRLIDKGDELVISVVADSWRKPEEKIRQTLVFDRE